MRDAYMDEFKVVPTTEQVHEYWSRINVKCRKVGLERALTKRYEDYWGNLMDNGEMSYVQGLDELREMSTAATNKMTEWVCITVNVDETKCTDPKKLLDLCQKYVARPFVSDYIFALEQRGKVDADRGKGVHAHILMKPVNTDGANLRRNTKSTFKKLTDHGVHIQYIHTAVEQAIPYVTGRKNSPEKMKGVEHDKEWRKLIGVQDWYTNLQEDFL